MRSRLPLLLILALLLLSPSLQAAVATDDPTAAHRVYVVRMDGVVSTGTVDTVRAALSRAETEGFEAVLIELDTDGGLVDATRDINQAISNSEVPVVTYVTPRGGRAFSAGTYVLLNGHVAAMAPETQIGAATPVQLGIRGEPDPAERKVMKAMAVYLGDIAAARGRNSTRAEQYVLDGETDSAPSALDRGMIDLVAASEPELLDEIEGRTVEVKGREVVVETGGATVTRHEPSLSGRFKSVISDPQVVFILFTVGLLGLWFGLQNPGLGAEVVGAVALVLALYGMGTFSSSVVAVLLIGLAGVFFVSELLTPAFGVLAAAGIITLIIGGLLLPSEPLMPRSWYGQFLYTVLGVSVGIGGFAVVAAYKILGARKRTPFLKEKLLVGGRGVAVEGIPAGGTGRVRARGTVWSATSNEDVAEGAEVVISDMEGLTLVVESA
ncbi:MAG: Membrane-bound protease [Methanonatronarchaeales archaeon]|nr:Membrane-bound protease [Methanonatronarchaeales archaeon]